MDLRNRTVHATRKLSMWHLTARNGNRRDGPTAFVLSVGLAGLGAIRSLGRAGVPVIGLDPYPSHVGFASRYCTAKQSPNPTREPERLVEFLLEEGRRLAEPAVLSPASDAFALFLSRYRHELGECFRFNLPSPEVLEATIDKRRLYGLAADLGIPFPTTYYPEHLDDVQHIKDALDYPAYIKPYHSHLWLAKFPYKGIKVGTPQELVAGFERVFGAGLQAMVQSIIVGPATNVQSVRVYVTAAGEELGVFTNRKIRQYPVEFGMASMAESIRSPELEALGLRFFRGINYRGYGYVEFKRDDRDGRLKITDLNPRWGKANHLATDSGIDFPLIHYLDLIGQTPSGPYSFKEGVRWLDALEDVVSSSQLIRAGELSPFACVRSWLGARSFATFALDDPGPFLKQYGYGLRLLRAPRYFMRQRRAFPT